MSSRDKLPSDNDVDTYVGFDFGDRLTFTVGVSYIVGNMLLMQDPSLVLAVDSISVSQRTCVCPKSSS